MKIGNIYLNRQFPDLKVQIIDLYKSRGSRNIKVYFRRLNADEKEPSASLDKEEFLKFYKYRG